MDESRPKDQQKPAPTTLTQRFREPSSLAGQYLVSAMELLRQAGSSEALWSEADPWHEGSLLESMQRSMDAANSRLQHLRGGTIFAALSVEAYANEFLACHFDEEHRTALDALRPIDKLLLPKSVGVEVTLDRGAEPLQTIGQLIRVRNRLVHSKPGEGTYMHEIDVPAARKDYGPKALAGYVERVAQMATLLHPLRGDRSFEMPFIRIWTERAVLHEHVEIIRPEVIYVPAEDLPPIVDLMLQMQRRAWKRSGQTHRYEARWEDPSAEVPASPFQQRPAPAYGPLDDRAKSEFPSLIGRRRSRRPDEPGH
jgi:hypothetical protein